VFEEINGEIKMDCNLSGVPEIFIFLSQSTSFNDYSVHECLLPRIETYEREKVLNLIPPTGSTTIFYYNIKGVQAKVPFDFRHKLTLTEVLLRAL
jgi:AP-3 complex subunit mu